MKRYIRVSIYLFLGVFIIPFCMHMHASNMYLAPQMLTHSVEVSDNLSLLIPKEVPAYSELYKVFAYLLDIFSPQVKDSLRVHIITDFEGLFYSLDQQQLYKQFFDDIVGNLPKDINVKSLRDELKRNNYTSVFGIPLHRELGGGRIIIDTKEFFPTCNVCKSRQMPKELFRKQYLQDSHYQIVECVSCGHIRNQNEPTDEELLRYYGIPYYEKNREKEKDGSEGYSNYLTSSFARVESAKENFISVIQRFVSEGLLVDVGSAGGYLLEAARQEGFEVIGIEPSQEIVQEAQKRFGFDNTVYVSDIEEVVRSEKIARKSVSAISFYNTLEHMKDPFRAIECANMLLDDEGIIALWLPNVDSILREKQGGNFQHFEYGHLHSFSVKTLVEVLEICGFEIAFLETPAPSKELTKEEKQKAQSKGVFKGEYMKVVARKVLDLEDVKMQRRIGFEKILQDRANIRDAIESGYLNTIIPSWDSMWHRLANLKQLMGDMTIDQHVLHTIDNIRDLSKYMNISMFTKKDYMRIVRIMLLHDVGKGREPHELFSVESARSILSYLGYSDKEIAQDLCIIRHHGSLGRITETAEQMTLNTLLDTGEDFGTLITLLGDKKEISILHAVQLLDIINRDEMLSSKENIQKINARVAFMKRHMKLVKQNRYTRWGVGVFGQLRQYFSMRKVVDRQI